MLELRNIEKYYKDIIDTVIEIYSSHYKIIIKELTL